MNRRGFCQRAVAAVAGLIGLGAIKDAPATAIRWKSSNGTIVGDVLHEAHCKKAILGLPTWYIGDRDRWSTNPPCTCAPTTYWNVNWDDKCR